MVCVRVCMRMHVRVRVYVCVQHKVSCAVWCIFPSPLPHMSVHPRVVVNDSLVCARLFLRTLHISSLNPTAVLRDGYHCPYVADGDPGVYRC